MTEVQSEYLINEWLGKISSENWKLEGGECHLSSTEYEHFATIKLGQTNFIVMFPLNANYFHLSADESLSTQLLILNNHPDIIGFGSFSVSTETNMVVFTTSTSLRTLSLSDLNLFWEQSVNARNILFQFIEENERL